MKIYWNKEKNSKNLIGQRVKELRTEKHISQKALAEQLQLAGYEFSDLTVLRIEQGTRFVPDYEVVALCSRSKFLTKLLKTFDKTFREIFPVFISTKRREKPSAFFDNNFVNNAYFSEAASSSSSHLASSSSKAPISSRMTCLCLWSS